MKANELMIGDIVMTPSGDISRVTQIVKDGYGIYVAVMNDKFNYYVDGIDGVHLTEAILYANGYQREVVADTIHFVSPDRRLILQNDVRYLNSNRDWYIHIDSTEMSTIGSAEFTYVHELQHILRLFGFDTDLKLEP